MTTPAGHYMIHMALCRLSEPQQMHVSFPDADADAIELMQTLDIRVVELIASTPIVDEWLTEEFIAEFDDLPNTHTHTHTPFIR